MRDNPVKSLLAQGGTVYGSEISAFPCPEIVRLYAAAGFSFAFIDMEHTTFSLEQVAAMIRAARQHGIVPIVRVPQGEYAFVSKALDAGAQGIIVPRVNTAAEVRDIVSWTKYPPRGVRGFGAPGVQSDHQAVSAPELLAHLDATTFVVVQIERGEAVANLDEMLSIPGVDCACLGYMDLSVDLGVPGEANHPKMARAIERVIDACDRHGVAPGIICPELDIISRWVARGMRFVSYASDGRLLADAAKAGRAACAALGATATPAAPPPASATRSRRKAS